MKVSTDACLFGAWVANELLKRETLHNSSLKFKNILEIGTGTGLLSLMVAQKIDARIDTVEIDEAACSQAKENIAASNWIQRIQLICSDVKLFRGQKKYDYIFSNPPFFENQLRSGNKKINMARHDEALTLEDLLGVINPQLSPGGLFAVLLPYHRADYFVSLAGEMQFHLQKRANIKQSIRHQYFRSILEFGRHLPQKTEQQELAIKEGDKYTGDFTSLLKDYYLYL